MGLYRLVDSRIAFDGLQLSVLVKGKGQSGWSPGTYHLFLGVVVTTAMTLEPKQVKEIRWMPRLERQSERTEPWDKGSAEQVQAEGTLEDRMRRGALLLAMMSGVHTAKDLMNMAWESARPEYQRGRMRLDREERRRLERLEASELGGAEAENDEEMDLEGMVAAGD